VRNEDMRQKIIQGIKIAKNIGFKDCNENWKKLVVLEPIS
jgi:hypothetical protein